MNEFLESLFMYVVQIHCNKDLNLAFVEMKVTVNFIHLCVIKLGKYLSFHFITILKIFLWVLYEKKYCYM